MILVLDTNAEEVFIGLWDKERSTWLSQENFLGGRQLNSLILEKLDKTFSHSQEGENVVDLNKTEISGLIVAAGPGSFTGLRIGISVANTISYVRNIPIVAPSETKDAEDLLSQGLRLLEKVEPGYSNVVVPFYGADPHITKPKS